MDDGNSENIENIDEAIDNQLPSCSKEIDDSDCRISCTDYRSLCAISENALSHITNLADSCDFGENRSDFIKKFHETFKNALHENILINSLPWTMKQKELTSPRKEDNDQMVEDALLAKLGLTVSHVAQKRKRFPEHCCRIYNIKMKHELQNLKKATIVDDSNVPPIDPPLSKQIKPDDRKNFTAICDKFKSLQENVQAKVSERKEFERKIGYALSLKD